MFGSKERKDFKKEKAYWKKVKRPANLRETYGRRRGRCRQRPDHTEPEGQAKEFFPLSMYLLHVL